MSPATTTTSGAIRLIFSMIACMTSGWNVGSPTWMSLICAMRSGMVAVIMTPPGRDGLSYDTRRSPTGGTGGACGVASRESQPGEGAQGRARFRRPRRPHAPPHRWRVDEHRLLGGEHRV